jgi:hypothetical protein
MSFDFRTKVEIEKSENPIGIDHKIFLIGSCFTDNMGARFSAHRMQSMVNPFGVLYNPLSIGRLLRRLKDDAGCREDELVEQNGLWHHFDFHGQFSGTDRAAVCRNINVRLNAAADFLKAADFLILTFGTSYVYEREDTCEVVANCHKFPARFFNRYRLHPDEIVSVYKELVLDLHIFNPNLKIIFTVSPVRHWKDGAHGNQVSKSVLLLAVDKLCNLFNKVWYFPAYELMMDDLRDYRFYDERMFNPSGQAVDYIWSRFVESWMNGRTTQFIRRVEKVVKAREHRFSGGPSGSYLPFLKQSIALVDDIMQQFPEADLKFDRIYFEKQLENYTKFL